MTTQYKYCTHCTEMILDIDNDTICYCCKQLQLFPDKSVGHEFAIRCPFCLNIFTPEEQEETQQCDKCYKKFYVTVESVTTYYSPPICPNGEE